MTDQQSTGTKELKKHSGKPIVETSKDRKHMLVLCPLRHLIESIPMTEWAGSHSEARYGNPYCVVTCSGTIPESE